MRWPLVHLIPLVASAAVTNVRVVDVSNTQVLIRFTAPDANACTVEVSEESDYDPLVHDVNGTYYSGASLDSREPSLQRGRERTVIVGKRTIERAASGVAYSRALQTATLHHYRITCGGDTATGTFVTQPPPLGDTHGDPPIPDPDYPGRSFSITPQFTRNATWIDPHSGVLHKRVQQSQDNNIFLQFNDNPFSAVIASTNWTDANNVLSATDSGASATYDGPSCGATCDWLILSLTYTPATSTENRIDVLRISANGSGDDATAANRTLEVCPVLPSTSTIDTEGACRDLALPQTTPAKVTLAALGIQDTWRLPGKREWTYVDLATAGNIRFGVRKKNSTGTISLDAVRIDVWTSTTGNVGTGGSYDRCSPVPRVDGTYLCVSFNPGAAGNLYAIHGETGESTFLGAIYSTGNFAIIQDNVLWDSTDPNVWYGQGSGDSQQYKYTYTGAGTEVAAGTKVTLTRTALTPGGEDIGPAIQTFVAANSAQYGGRTFASASFNCPIDAVQGDYLMITCRQQQDTYAWLAAYRISTNTIVAAMPMFAAPVSRWCVAHSRQPAGSTTASWIDATFPKDQYAGNGIYKSTLVGDITSGTTSVTVTSTCGGDATCSAHVTGEPVATVGDDYLQAAEVGDVFVIDSEYVRITAKASATSWTIARGQNGSTAVSHTGGATFNCHCANKPGAGPANYIGTPFIIWDFVGDPYGMDATGTYTWANLYTGHASTRGNLIVANKSVAQSAEGTSILATTPDPTYDRNPPEVGWFAAKQPPGQGNCYQQHPNIGQISAGLYDRQFFFDIRPFVGGNCFSAQTPGCTVTNANYPASGGCVAARVSGLSNVYKVTFASADDNPDGLNPKHLATIGNSGAKVLRDISSSTAVLDDDTAKDYTFCVAVASDECVTGSSTGDAYVQIPSLTVFYCDGSNTTADVCLGDYYAQGVTLSRYGFLRQKDGLSTSLVSNANAVGAGYIQRLSMHGLNLFYNSVSLFTTGKPLANGKWALAADWVETPGGRALLTLVKIPPAIKDSRSRATFQPLNVPSGTVPTGTSTVLAEFGYAENGAATDFRCTSRAEACVAVTSSIDASNPFFWASESYSRLSCGSGCTVALPVLAGRTVYYRLKAYNAGGTLIYTGPLEARIVY